MFYDSNCDSEKRKKTILYAVVRDANIFVCRTVERINSLIAVCTDVAEDKVAKKRTRKIKKKRDEIRSGYRLFGPLFDTIELETTTNQKR